jgi:hypothetical protein
MKWPDQPFEEITMGDIFDIPSMGDDLFCLQVGLTVKALVASNTSANSSVQDATPIIIGSDVAEEISTG